MTDAMVTARMPMSKKEKGNSVLKRAGLTASEAINLLYDRLIEEQDASFVEPEPRRPTEAEWKEAFAFIDSIPKLPRSEFADMTLKEAKLHRLRSKGLL